MFVNYFVAPADYDKTIQDLTFDGSTDRNCVTIPIVNDDALEATESFTASLTTSDPAVILNPDLARVDIFEDPNDSKNTALFNVMTASLEVLSSTFQYVNYHSNAVIVCP